jgi:hypothetical protein
MATQYDWLALIEENNSIYENDETKEPAYQFSGRTFYQEEDTGAYSDE